jgi:hypothetical protein
MDRRRVADGRRRGAVVIDRDPNATALPAACADAYANPGQTRRVVATVPVSDWSDPAVVEEIRKLAENTPAPID